MTALLQLQQDEVDRNYQAFVEQLPELMQTHPGKFALMRDGRTVEFFDTARDAYVAGNSLFKGKPFSIQEIVDVPADLGYFSHVVPGRQV